MLQSEVKVWWTPMTNETHCSQSQAKLKPKSPTTPLPPLPSTTPLPSRPTTNPPPSLPTIRIHKGVEVEPPDGWTFPESNFSMPAPLKIHTAGRNTGKYEINAFGFRAP